MPGTQTLAYIDEAHFGSVCLSGRKQERMNEDRRKMREVVEFRRQAPVAGRNNINAQMSHLGQLALAFMEASLDLHGYHLNTIDRLAPATYRQQLDHHQSLYSS